MHRLLELWHQLYNLEALIRWGGYVVLTTVVFTETGLLVGFFLPGDSLMVTAGLLASQGFLNVYLMGVILSIAAIAGDSVGYAIGKATGPRIFTRENSLCSIRNICTVLTRSTRNMAAKRSCSRVSCRSFERSRLLWLASAKCATARSSCTIRLAALDGCGQCCSLDTSWVVRSPV